MDNNTRNTVSDVVNILAAALQLGSNLGVDLAAVSSAISLAHAQGRTLGAAELQTFIDEWQASDTAEQAAYDQRMRNPLE